MSYAPLEARLSQAILSSLLRLGGWRFDHLELYKDLARFRVQMQWVGEMDDRSLFVQFAEIRTLAYYRWEIGKGRFHHRLLGKLLKLCFPPQGNLYLWTQQIGPGFVPFHAFSTVVAAKHVGCNVTVFQGVTIGHAGAGKAPKIGDHVTIYANACVIGDITIGDYAVIGAGAVVVKDVPPGAVVVGNPARILRTSPHSVDGMMEECRHDEDCE